MKNIITVVGARPQFIKAAPVSLALSASALLNETIIHTGQHFDRGMSDVFFEELNIPTPLHNLGVGGGTHAYNTGRAMEGIEKILKEERPDGVLVYGDTDTTLAGALVAAKENIPLFHVEAGLRSYNRRMPEEINRILTDHASSLLFSSTLRGALNLANEGIDNNKIRIVGDVMFDAVLRFSDLAKKKSTILEKIGLQESGYVLATIHRKENTDDKEVLNKIFRAMESSSYNIVLPVHPRLRKIIDDGGGDFPVNATLIEPVGYLDMLSLLRNCVYVITDSGGLQKEAYFHEKKCVIARSETEWVELVAEGMAILGGVSLEGISAGIAEVENPDQKIINKKFIYGDGTAAQKIVSDLEGFYFGN